MSTPFNIGTFLMHLTPMHNDTDKGDDKVNENIDNDESKYNDDVLQEDSMQVAAQDHEDDTDQCPNPAGTETLLRCTYVWRKYAHIEYAKHQYMQESEYRSTWYLYILTKMYNYKVITGRVYYIT